MSYSTSVVLIAGGETLKFSLKAETLPKLIDEACSQAKQLVASHWKHICPVRKVEVSVQIGTSAWRRREVRRARKLPWLIDEIDQKMREAYK